MVSLSLSLLHPLPPAPPTSGAGIGTFCWPLLLLLLSAGLVTCCSLLGIPPLLPPHGTHTLFFASLCPFIHFIFSFFLSPSVFLCFFLVSLSTCNSNTTHTTHYHTTTATPQNAKVLLSFEQEVHTTDLLRVDSTGNNTKLLILKARRDMTGKYVLKAKNKHGEDSVQIDITVLGTFVCVCVM